MDDDLRDILREELRRDRDKQRREDADRSRPNRPMNDAIRATIARARAEQAGLAQPGELRPTKAEILAKKAELAAEGKPSGHRPLAVALHSTVSTIRRRLGK